MCKKTLLNWKAIYRHKKSALLPKLKINCNITIRSHIGGKSSMFLIFGCFPDFPWIQSPYKNVLQNYVYNTRFFIRKPFFCLSLKFLNITLEITLRFSSYFFLTFISLFSLIFYLIRFNTNSKRHFLNNGETKEF